MIYLVFKQFIEYKATNNSLSRSYRDRQFFPQSKLPLHARATASTAIKNNLANTELETGPDTSHLMNKTQRIISLHQQHRQNQRLQVRVTQ